MKKAILLAFICVFLVGVQIALEQRWVKLKPTVQIEEHFNMDSAQRVLKIIPKANTELLLERK